MNAPTHPTQWRAGAPVQPSGETRPERAVRRRIDWQTGGKTAVRDTRRVQPTQKEFVAILRAESCLDTRWRLAIPTYSRPLSGPSVADYYAAKHRRGERGKYYPLHIIAFTSTRPSR